MNRFVTLILLAAISFPALAQQDTDTFIYSRTVFKLIPKPEPKPITIPSPLPAPIPSPKEPVEKVEKGKLYTKADNAKKEDPKVIKAPDPDTPPAPPPRVPIDYTVEFKSQDFLKGDDVINHSVFPDHEGIALLIEPPGTTSVESTFMLGSSDIIFINEDGFITRIAPKLDMHELSEPIKSGGPVRAVLFLKAGAAEQDRLIPGDRFENEVFKTHPVIIQ